MDISPRPVYLLEFNSDLSNIGLKIMYLKSTI